MSNVSAALVKELREKTGVGFMDCKKALVEKNNDLEAAIDWLKEKGLAKAAKKGGRITAEGVVINSVDGDKAIILEINTETDFVAKNDKFKESAKKIADIALAKEINDIEDLKNAEFESGKTVQDHVNELITVIGENIQLRRIELVKSKYLVSYSHNVVAPNIGNIGVLVGLETDSDNIDRITEIGKNVAMHIAAINPMSLTSDEIDEDTINREKAIFKEQAKASGKPDNIIDKMVEGRVRKFFSEVVLLEQQHVIEEGKLTVKEVLSNASKELGSDLSITLFRRYKVGDGIEKKEENFAEEVAAAAKG